MHKILNNLSWIVAEKVLVLISNIFILIIIANHYGSSTFGFYQYAMSITVLVSILLLLIDGRIVKKEYEFYSFKTVVLNTTLGKLFLGIISFSIGLIVILFSNRGSEYSNILVILLLNIIIINLSFGIQNYFEYHLQSKKVVIASNIATIISVTFQIIAVYLNFPIIAIAIILVISNLIKLIIIVFQYLLISKNYEKGEISVSLIKKIITYSIPLSIAASAAIIYTKVDQVMLGNMINDSSVGVYAVSTKMLNVATILILPIQVSVFPKMLELYKHNKDKYLKFYKSLTCTLTLISLFIIVIALLLGNLLIGIIFSEEYQASFKIFQIQIFVSLFMYNAALRSSHFTITEDTKIIMVTQIIAVVLNILLNVVLINFIGIYGAAIATVLTQFFSLFISNLFFKNSKILFEIQLRGFNVFNGYKDLKNIILNYKKKERNNEN